MQEVVNNTATTSNGSSENPSVQTKSGHQPLQNLAMQSKQVPDKEEEDFDVLSPKLESLYERRFDSLSIDPKWLKKKHPELSIIQISHPIQTMMSLQSIVLWMLL